MFQKKAKNEILVSRSSGITLKIIIFVSEAENGEKVLFWVRENWYFEEIKVKEIEMIQYRLFNAI